MPLVAATTEHISTAKMLLGLAHACTAYHVRLNARVAAQHVLDALPERIYAYVVGIASEEEQEDCLAVAGLQILRT